MLLVEMDGLGELLTGSAQLATSGKFLRACEQIVCSAFDRDKRLSRRRALLFQRLPKPVVSLAQLGVPLESLLEGGNGAGQISALPQRLPQLVVHAGVVRISRGDTPQVLERRFGVAFFAQGHPEVRMSGQAVWLEGQRLFKHRHCLGKIATLDQGRAEIGVSAPVGRIQLHGLSQRGDCARQIGLLCERDTQPVVRLGRRRSNLHGALEGTQRARGIIPVPICQAQGDVQFGIAGIARDCGLELFHRGRSIARRPRRGGHWRFLRWSLGRGEVLGRATGRRAQ